MGDANPEATMKQKHERAHERAAMPPRSGRRGARAERKDAQLCAAVAEIVGLTLGADTDDEELTDLFVREVVPWPDLSRLLVVFEAAPGADAAALELRVAQYDGLIRSEVAQELQ